MHKFRDSIEIIPSGSVRGAPRWNETSSHSDQSGQPFESGHPTGRAKVSAIRSRSTAPFQASHRGRTCVWDSNSVMVCNRLSSYRFDASWQSVGSLMSLEVFDSELEQCLRSRAFLVGRRTGGVSGTISATGWSVRRDAMQRSEVSAPAQAVSHKLGRQKPTCQFTFIAR